MPLRNPKEGTTETKMARNKQYTTSLSSALSTGEKLTSDQWNAHNQELFAQRQVKVEAVTEMQERVDEIAANRRAGAAMKRESDLKVRRIRKATSELERINAAIVKTNYGLVRNYVSKFTQVATADAVADLEGAAVLGLVKAIDTYDPSKGKFASWAWKPIQREVLAAVRSADHQNLNTGDFEARPSILDAVRSIKADNEEAIIDYSEVSRISGATTGQVQRVLEAPKLDSISMPVGEGSTTLGDLIEDTQKSVEDTVLSGISTSALDSSLGELDMRERFVLNRRTGLDAEPTERLAEIGAVLGLSREAVRQIEVKAMSKLTHPAALSKILADGNLK